MKTKDYTLLTLIFIFSILFAPACASPAAGPETITPANALLTMSAAGGSGQPAQFLGMYSYYGDAKYFPQEDSKCMPDKTVAVSKSQLAVWSAQQCVWVIVEANNSWETYMLYGLWDIGASTLHDIDGLGLSHQHDGQFMTVRVIQYVPDRDHELQVEVMGKHHYRSTGWISVEAFTPLDQLPGFVASLPIVENGLPLFFYTQDGYWIRRIQNADGYCVPSVVAPLFGSDSIAIWDVWECQWAILGPNGSETELHVESSDLFVFMSSMDFYDTTNSAVIEKKTIFRVLGVSNDKRPWLYVEDLNGTLGRGYIDLMMLPSVPFNPALLDLPILENA